MFLQSSPNQVIEEDGDDDIDKDKTGIYVLRWKFFKSLRVSITPSKYYRSMFIAISMVTFIWVPTCPCILSKSTPLPILIQSFRLIPILMFINRKPILFPILVHSNTHLSISNKHSFPLSISIYFIVLPHCILVFIQCKPISMRFIALIDFSNVIPVSLLSNEVHYISSWE